MIAGKSFSQPETDRRHSLYKSYVAKYPEVFRANIDFQHEEKPHQLLWGLAFVALLVAFGFCQKAFPKSVLNPVQTAAIAVMLALVFYSVCQVRDSLFVRPHPAFWRIVHGVALAYLLLLAVLIALDVDGGRKLVKALYSGAGETNTLVVGTSHNLDCTLTWRAWKNQLTKVWVICHVACHFLKMCIFRDWAFCLVDSIAFEVMELSLQSIVPDFKECWWDSLILDVCICNNLGLVLGELFLRFLNSYKYDSEESRPIWKKAFRRLMPFWHFQWRWVYFATPYRLICAFLMLLASVIYEANNFFLFAALNINPTKSTGSMIVVGLRYTILTALMLPAAAEHYDFVNTRRRVGLNTWLVVLILVMEVSIVGKYWDTGEKAVKLPEAGVWLPLVATAALLCVWLFVRVNYEDLFTPDGVYRPDSPSAVDDSQCNRTQPTSYVSSNPPNLRLRRRCTSAEPAISSEPCYPSHAKTGSEATGQSWINVSLGACFLPLIFLVRFWVYEM